MKVPLPLTSTLPCLYRGVENVAVTSVGKRFGDWNCTACGRENPCIVDLNFTIGHQILLRAQQEHHCGEFWLAILLAAMAIESELGRLFVKWKSIDEMANLGSPVWVQAQKKQVSPFVLVTQKAEKEFQDKFRSIASKIEGVAKLLCTHGIDNFVEKSEFAAIIRERYPSLVIGNLAKRIRAIVFVPRNEIAHLGRSARTQEESLRAYNIASIVLGILAKMDEQRRTELQSRISGSSQGAV